MWHRLRQSQAVRALRRPAFRWYILGRLAGSSTGPLRSIVQGWLVYQLTGSILALGAVGSLRSGAMALVAPLAGVLSDRMDKRMVMFWARMSLTLTNLALAALALTGALQLWHLFVGAVLEGIALAVKDPAEQAMLAELVSHGALASAISTTSVFEGLMGMVSATLGGVLLDRTGAGSLFIALAVFFSLAGFTYLHLPRSASADREGGAVHHDALDALRYLRKEPVLQLLLGIAFMRILLLLPYSSFLPALTEQRFEMDAAGLGWLQSAAGAGRLLSSLIIASRGYISKRAERRSVILSGAAAGLVLILFVRLPLLPLPFLLIALMSALSSVSRVMNRSLLQVDCRPRFRGRVIAISMMLMHLAQLGTVPTGALADRYGVVTVLTLLGVLATGFFVVAGWLWEHLRVAEQRTSLQPAPPQRGEV